MIRPLARFVPPFLSGPDAASQEHQAPQRTMSDSTRHHVSGEEIVALDLHTKKTLAVPPGVMRSREHNMTNLVIHAKEVCKDLFVDVSQRREYHKLRKVTDTDASEVYLIGIPDPVVTQVFVGKHPKQREIEYAGPGAVPAPFRDPDVENEIRQAFDLDSPYKPHAVIIFRRERAEIPPGARALPAEGVMVLQPLARGDAFDVLRALRKEGRVPFIVRQFLINVFGELATKFHRKNRAHKDIKLQNVFVDAFGNFYLCDLGNTHETTLGGKIGSNAAPESFMGGAFNTLKLDVWAAAAAAMELAINDKFFTVNTLSYYDDNLNTAAGRRVVREDLQAYTRVWQEFGGVFSDTDRKNFRSLYADTSALRQGSRRVPRDHLRTGLTHRPKARFGHLGRGGRSTVSSNRSSKAGIARPNRDSSGSLALFAGDDAHETWRSTPTPGERVQFEDMQRIAPEPVERSAPPRCRPRERGNSGRGYGPEA